MEQIGSYLWGGRRWPEKVTDEAAPVDDARGLPPGVGVALASIILVVLGAAAVAVGAGLLWGLGAGILAGGGVALGIGLLLGMSS